VTSEIQQRVTVQCIAGSSIRVMNQNGTVECETDDIGAGGGDITAVYAGNGLTGGYISGDVTVGLDTAYADGRYVDEGQASGVTSGMIVDGVVGAADLQDGAALAEIADDDGAGSGLDADRLDGQHASAFALASHSHDASYLRLGGNAGTTPGARFLGTTDLQAPELKVNGARTLRLEPRTYSPNLVGGYGGNSVTADVEGATIGGGGEVAGGGPFDLPNLVTDHHGTVGGGAFNRGGFPKFVAACQDAPRPARATSLNRPRGNSLRSPCILSQPGGFG
jgi:hypothetical protein